VEFLKIIKILHNLNQLLFNQIIQRTRSSTGSTEVHFENTDSLQRRTGEASMKELGVNWTSAAIKTSEEILHEARSQKKNNLNHQFSIQTIYQLVQKSIGSRVFLMSLLFWSGVYFTLVKGGYEDSISSVTDTESVESKTIGVKSSEYTISDEERGHWSLSLLHSLVTVICSFCLLHSSNEKRKWWKLSNDQQPFMVALVSFSASYFLIDTAFVMSEVGYVIHHG
jgi:hypothetical protein